MCEKSQKSPSIPLYKRGKICGFPLQKGEDLGFPFMKGEDLGLPFIKGGGFIPTFFKKENTRSPL